MNAKPSQTLLLEAPQQNGHNVDLQSTLRELQAAVTALQHGLQRAAIAVPSSELPEPAEQPRERDTYEHLVVEVRSAVHALVPEGATVAVISRGDEALLVLPGHHGRHFPETAGGVYAGHHPADSTSAIVQIEAARARGVEYLLFPATGFWWLEHYDGFARYVESRYRLLHRDEHCLIYDLTTIVVADGACEASLRSLATELAALTEHELRQRGALIAAEHARAARDEELRAALQAVEAALTGPSRRASLRCQPPAEWLAGETKTYVITLTNAGTRSWSARGQHPVRLAVHFGGESDWPHDDWATDERLVLPDDVPPGGSTTVSVMVTAPDPPGAYVLRHRLVEENTADGWFDDIHRIGVVVVEAPNGVVDAARPASVDYPELVSAIRSRVEATVPTATAVAVVSRGDDGLLRFHGREGRHFPQMEDGVYAGHYPEDSAAAVAHLEAVRMRGAGYILFPATAFWWLEHYAGLRRHLDERHDLLWHDGTCVIYALHRRDAPDSTSAPRSFWARLFRRDHRAAGDAVAELRDGVGR